MPAAGRHVEAHVAQQVEAAVEAFIRVALLEQCLDVGSSLFQQPGLDVIAHARNVVAILLREIQLLERRIHLLEVVADPAIECLGITRHRLRSMEVRVAAAGCGILTMAG